MDIGRGPDQRVTMEEDKQQMNESMKDNGKKSLFTTYNGCKD